MSAQTQGWPGVAAPAAGWPGPAGRPLAAPGHALRRPRLFVDAQHGLGNRLRAIASAAVIAEATGRELVVVWQPDHHCGARFTDLFRHGGAVIETAFPQVFARAGGTLWNYMEVEPGAAKDAPVLADESVARGGDVYVRSAYRLVSPHLSAGAERAWLRALQPAPEVLELMRGVRRPNRVAAHVRMAGGPAYEHLSYEAPTNWPARGHAEIAAWRARSHARYFMARLDALVAAGAAETIFLAADLPETYEAFADRYGRRLAWLPRRHFDRSPEQMRHALADVLLLGGAEHFLGSTWSTFSELALALSQTVQRVEFSGRDF
jgi:hypothetical protein